MCETLNPYFVLLILPDLQGLRAHCLDQSDGSF